MRCGSRSSTLRVLHVLPSLDPETGGPARSVPALCLALHKAGISTTLFTFGTGQTDTWAYPYELVRFRPLSHTRQVPTLAYLRALRETAPKFDLVHLHSLWNTAITASASVCRRVSVPYLISPRGTLQRTSLSRRAALKRLYAAICENRTIRHARGLHFLTAEEAAESLPLIPKGMPTQVVPNGIDPASLVVPRGNFRRAFPQLGTAPFLLFVGRLHPIKNLALQAQVCELLFPTFPTLKWVLIGPDDGEWAALAAWAAAHGYSDRILWTGLQPHARVVEALVDANLLLMTSHTEAQPMALTEALGAGTPVVMTQGMGFSAPAAAGAAFAAEPTAVALAEAVRGLLASPGEAAKLGESARRYALNHFSWPSVAASMQNFYAETLDRTKHPGSSATPR